MNGEQFIPGPQKGEQYEYGGRTFTVIDWRWHNNACWYTVEFEDEPGQQYEETYSFSHDTGSTVEVRCGLAVEEFHGWIGKQRIFEDLFGSHLHAQLLSNTGYNFVTYLSNNGLLTPDNVDLMVCKVRTGIYPCLHLLFSTKANGSNPC